MQIGRHDYSVLAFHQQGMLLVPGWTPHLSLRHGNLSYASFQESELPLELRAAVTSVRLGANPWRPHRGGSLESLLSQFAQPQENPPLWIHKALGLVFEHCREPWSLPQLADSVGVSPAYLTTQVRRWTGRSLGQWSIRARLDYAAMALRQPDSTVARVAEASGFSDLAHFRRLYRRQFQHSPRSL